MSDLFDRVAGSYDRYVDGPIPRRISAHLVAQVRGRLPPGARLLDVGCGPGHDAVRLAQLGYDVTGLDVAPEMIRQLQNRAREAGAPVRTVLGDVLQVDLPRAGFDAAYALMGPLGYTPDPSPILHSIRPWIRPGGWLWLGLARGAHFPGGWRHPAAVLRPPLGPGPTRQRRHIAGEAIDVYLWDPRRFASALPAGWSLVGFEAIGVLPKAPPSVDAALGRRRLLRRFGAVTFMSLRADP